ncbi:hypothetical protein DM01DRAFT_1336850 [Hesseltinella vesiculosa]|uniref:Uncharacterized protein n=1 Tax=Hesseltinella vesiculosa TaxID=101127 RepID=A0A1X2GFD2_9FUNG|nr:hypothetical protein DM01DRAFT_1336850 [Hesseltinella vesiculosa]
MSVAFSGWLINTGFFITALTYSSIPLMTVASRADGALVERNNGTTLFFKLGSRAFF